MGRYLAYMQSQETAYIYDWWCGLWCISAACGRAIHVARPRAPVFLNMFLILVGESGAARKTASVTTSTRVVRNLHDSSSTVALLDGKATAEALDEILRTRTELVGSAQLCIASPELATLLGNEAYMASVPAILTDVYDCPTIRHGGSTIMRGICVQQNIWVSLLAASTPIWLLRSVNPNVVEGGFTSRCLFITSNTPKRSIAWPEETDETLWQDIQDDMRIIRAEAQTRPNIELDPTAMSAFRLWYGKRDRSLDPFRQSFEAREDAHVLRVAALLCINDGTWTIQRSHVATAIQLVAEVKEQSGSIFEGAETRTKFARAIDSVRAMLISTGMDPVPRHKLFKVCQSKLTHDEFIALVETLHEFGALQRFEVKSDGRGRPTEFYRGTELLLAKGLGQQVLERFV
jgi:hypothetical protein